MNKKELNKMVQDVLNQKAWEYAEKYGIIDFDIQNDLMKYEVSYFQEGFRYECTVDLNTMKETRKPFKLKK